MAVTYPHPTGDQSAGAAASLTYSQTVDSGTKALYVFVRLYNTTAERTVSTVTWNGTSLSFVGRALKGFGGTDFWCFEVWVLEDPSPATGNVVITPTASVEIAGVSCGVAGVATPTYVRGTPAVEASEDEDWTYQIVAAQSGDPMLFAYFASTDEESDPSGSGTPTLLAEETGTIFTTGYLRIYSMVASGAAPTIALALSAYGFGGSIGLAFIEGTSGSVASATGSGIASGVGRSTARAQGTSAGTGSAAAIGRATARSTATASGTGTASGSAQSSAKSIATAGGSATVTAVGRSTARSTASSVGGAVATGVGRSTVRSAASASGTSTATANGKSTARAVGTAAGSSTALGISQAGSSIGTAAGTSTAAAVGASTVRSTGSAAGVGTASAVGRSSHRAVGTATGTSTVIGIAVIGAGVGQAAGSSTAIAVGRSTVRATGTATGSSQALGVSPFVSPDTADLEGLFTPSVTLPATYSPTITLPGATP